MDNGPAIFSMVVNTGFAVAVATYLLLKTSSVLEEMMKTICQLKKSIELLSEKIELIKRR